MRYYQLIKPGIVYGNALTAAAGFFLASWSSVHWYVLCMTLVGLSLIIASACVCNNYLDRDIDAHMERTKNRALAAGEVSTAGALVFALALLLLGVLTLYFQTNFLTLAVALAGFAVYVAVYTPLKRRSGYALFVGAIAGAAPPVVGYAAVADKLDFFALALFIFLFLWQLPHFFAISVYRFDEYAAAGVPLLIRKMPTASQKLLGRRVFFLSLVVLLVCCALTTLPYLAALILHK